MKIKDIKSIQILDSRGNPTLRTFVYLENGLRASSSIPSGASTGKYEAVELRDEEKDLYHGKSVFQAVENVNTIIKEALLGQSAASPDIIDKIMIDLDGTDNKAHLGANAILSVSQAVVKAAAKTNKMALWEFINQYYFKNKSPAFPRLMVNIVNGGKHANWRFDIQEFMIIPRPLIPSQALRITSEIFIELGKNLVKQGFSTLVGNEGGYSPAYSSNSQVFEKIIEAASQLNYHQTDQYDLGIDAAASGFYEKDGRYFFRKKNKRLSGAPLLDYYGKIIDKYNLFLIEDPFDEDDWQNFTRFTARFGQERIVIGDDIYVTNKKRIQRGIDEKASNTALIKPNQIGTILETVEAIKTARRGEMKIAVSHRSGETSDSFIADFAYGAAADFLKTGSMSRSERLAKYNRLLEIENKL